jgi:hypothetical protein
MKTAGVGTVLYRGALNWQICTVSLSSGGQRQMLGKNDAQPISGSLG